MDTWNKDKLLVIWLSSDNRYYCCDELTINNVSVVKLVNSVVKLVNSRSTLKINYKKLTRFTLMSATRHSNKNRKEVAYRRILYKRGRV